ncbi:MAG: hypothetical protein M0Z75_13730 [Nitrospiraceae bacterium]|nr:hypothetical protein [Nitrospiraceae bacterium]
MTNHTALMKMATEFLEWSGWFVYPNVEGRSKSGRHTYPGASDMTAVKCGTTLWIEVKVGGDTLSKDQERFRDDILAHGGHHLELRDSLDGLVEYIKGLRMMGDKI